MELIQVTGVIIYGKNHTTIAKLLYQLFMKYLCSSLVKEQKD